MKHVAGQIAEVAHGVADRRDDFRLARLSPRGRWQLVFADEELQALQDGVRFLARVLAEADEFVAGEDRAFDRGAGVIGMRAEIERDIGAHRA